MLVTKNCGVPVTVTASLNLTLTSILPPSDLSNSVVMNSISVISAEPRATFNSPIATRTSGVASVLSFPLKAEPASRTHPLVFANTSFFSASVRYLGFDSSESLAPHKGIFFSL